jgi:HYDIN/CFA65/VesB family protein
MYGRTLVFAEEHAVRSWLTQAVGAGCVFLSMASARSQDDSAKPKQNAGGSTSIQITPRSLDFGTQAVGSLTQPKTATLVNSGVTVLKITDIITSGIDFSQTNACGDRLTPGASCAILVTFKPAIIGPRIATVQILDSDPGSPQSIILNGTGR